MLAIIIPFYKLTFFEKTLESLKNQTNKQFKVYIGDDASPENPIFLLEKFKGKIDFVYHRFESNLGSLSLTQHWERCIDLSKNEKWCLILGDDDILGKNAVAVFYDNLNKILVNQINVVRFSSQKIDSEDKVISDVYTHPQIETSTDFLFRKDTRSSLSEYVFFKEKLILTGFRNFPLAWFSDVLAVLEFSDFKNVYSLNDAVVSVRVSKLSISGNSNFLKEKNQSKFAFYYHLLSNKKSFFTDQQKDKLFLEISKCYINEKKQFKFFFKISWLYLKSKALRDYLYFIKSVFHNTLKNRARK